MGKEDLLDLIGLKGNAKINVESVDRDQLLALFVLHNEENKKPIRSKFSNFIRKSKEGLLGKKKSKKQNEEKEIAIIEEPKPEDQKEHEPVPDTEPINKETNDQIENVITIEPEVTPDPKEDDEKIDIVVQDALKAVPPNEIKTPEVKTFLQNIKENKLFVIIVFILILAIILIAAIYFFEIF